MLPVPSPAELYPRRAFPPVRGAAALKSSQAQAALTTYGYFLHNFLAERDELPRFPDKPDEFLTITGIIGSIGLLGVVENGGVRCVALVIAVVQEEPELGRPPPRNGIPLMFAEGRRRGLRRRPAAFAALVSGSEYDTAAVSISAG